MASGESYHRPYEGDTDAGSGFHGLQELEGARVRSLLPSDIESGAELLMAKVILGPSEAIPAHTHPDHSEGIFVLRGSVIALRGSGKAELGLHGLAYFPCGTPHGVQAQPDSEAELLLFYPRADVARALTSEIEEPRMVSRWPNPNVVKGDDFLWRWVTAEDAEPWVPAERSKGMDVTVRFLMDPLRGSPDLAAGTGMTRPHTHYTIHRHGPAELYHILDGRGIYYVGDQRYEVQTGSTLYVPSMVPHGADTADSHCTEFWVYGLDGGRGSWVWEALEDIYNTPRLP